LGRRAARGCSAAKGRTARSVGGEQDAEAAVDIGAQGGFGGGEVPRGQGLDDLAVVGVFFEPQGSVLVDDPVEIGAVLQPKRLDHGQKDLGAGQAVEGEMEIVVGFEVNGPAGRRGVLGVSR